MVKMASRIKQQKPGEIRGKTCNAENFIKATTEATDKSKQILAALKAILQVNMEESPRGTREQGSRERPKASLVDSFMEAEKANKDQKQRSKSTNTKGKASLHPGQDRLGNL